MHSYRTILIPDSLSDSERFCPGDIKNAEFGVKNFDADQEMDRIFYADANPDSVQNVPINALNFSLKTLFYPLSSD